MSFQRDALRDTGHLLAGPTVQSVPAIVKAYRQ